MQEWFQSLQHGSGGHLSYGTGGHLAYESPCPSPSCGCDSTICCDGPYTGVDITIPSAIVVCSHCFAVASNYQVYTVTIPAQTVSFAPFACSGSVGLGVVGTFILRSGNCAGTIIGSGNVTCGLSYSYGAPLAPTGKVRVAGALSADGGIGNLWWINGEATAGSDCTSGITITGTTRNCTGFPGNGSIFGDGSVVITATT